MGIWDTAMDRTTKRVSRGKAKKGGLLTMMDITAKAQTKRTGKKYKPTFRAKRY